MGVLQFVSEVTGHGQEVSFPKFDTFDGTGPHRTTSVNWEEVMLLPDPVKRYFVHVLKVDCPLVKATYFTQEGRLREIGEKKWLHFHASEQLSGTTPTLTWKARLQYRPGLALTIEDNYADGEAASRVKMLKFIPLKSVRSSKELAEASLQRYLAECVFAPTMLLPQSGVEWQALTPNSARARLQNGAHTAELDFHFAPTGEVLTVSTRNRWAYQNGKFQSLPWRGTFMGSHWNYGQKVPRYGEVAWEKDGIWHTVWQAKWTSHSFDYN